MTINNTADILKETEITYSSRVCTDCPGFKRAVSHSTKMFVTFVSE